MRRWRQRHRRGPGSRGPARRFSGPLGPLVDPGAQEPDLVRRQPISVERHDHAFFETHHQVNQLAPRTVAGPYRGAGVAPREQGFAAIERASRSIEAGRCGSPDNGSRAEAPISFAKSTFTSAAGGNARCWAKPVIGTRRSTSVVSHGAQLFLTCFTCLFLPDVKLVFSSQFLVSSFLFFVFRFSLPVFSPPACLPHQCQRHLFLICFKPTACRQPFLPRPSSGSRVPCAGR